MPLFADESGYDRKRLMLEAQRARARGRHRRAIVLYQYAQSREPGCAEIAARLAPILAYEGRHYEAWRQFRAAGKILLRQGRVEWALSIFHEATRCMPQECEAWRVSAELERKLGRDEQALQTLIEGRSHFRSALRRDQAIALLEQAREIEPWHPDVTVDLAGLLSQTGQGARALEILEELAQQSDESLATRARAAQFRITWSPQHAWLWLTSAVPRLAPDDLPVAMLDESLPIRPNVRRS